MTSSVGDGFADQHALRHGSGMIGALRFDNRNQIVVGQRRILHEDIARNLDRVGRQRYGHAVRHAYGAGKFIDQTRAHRGRMILQKLINQFIDQLFFTQGKRSLFREKDIGQHSGQLDAAVLAMLTRKGKHRWQLLAQSTHHGRALRTDIIFPVLHLPNLLRHLSKTKDITE